MTSLPKMNPIVTTKFEETKRNLVLERENFNRNSLRGRRAIIAIDDNQIIRYDPAEGEELFKPEYEIVDIDLNKIEASSNKLHPYHTMNLVEFYEDGLLIRFDAPKTAFFAFKVVPIKTEKILHDMKAYNTNTIISARSFNKNSIERQHTFFVTSFFKKWISKSFKDYLYIIVDNYSKTKAFKVPLKQFEHYEAVKKYYCNKTKAIEDETHPKGFERSYFKKMIQNNTQWSMRATTVKHSKQGKQLCLRLSWLQAMEKSLSALANYGFPFVGAQKDEWHNIYAKATAPEETRNKSVIRLGLTFFADISEKEIEAYIKEYFNSKEKKSFSSHLGKKEVEFVEYAVNLFTKIPTIKDKYTRKTLLLTVASECKNFTYHELQNVFEYFLRSPTWCNSGKIDIYNAFHVWFHYLAKLTILLFHTGYGEKLPSGRIIDYSNFTETDARIYWQVLPFPLLVHDYVEEHESPIVLEENNIFNSSNDPDEYLKYSFHDAEVFGTPKIEESVDKNIKEILSQALDNSLYIIPYKACIELHDPIFKYMRLVEEEFHIHIFIYDENERFLYEVLEKKSKTFRGYLFHPSNMKDKNTKDIYKDFYTAFATGIRDLKVTINRDVVLGPVRYRVPTGIKTKRKRIIYLPRIKYRYIKDTKPIENEIKLIRKSSGSFRSHHIRKLPATYHPSPLQIILARKQNIEVPQGHTYVRGAVVGQGNMSEDEIIYRSRNLTSAIYHSEKLLCAAHEIVNMSGAAFEEHCRRLLSQMGWDVGKIRVRDGGIDIEAYQSVVKNEQEKLVRLFVQCKQQKKNVGPDVIRELLGAKEVEDKEYETQLMVMISSKFSSGAVLLAREKGIKLIDGNDLLK